jgi:hypothetical protein
MKKFKSLFANRMSIIALVLVMFMGAGMAAAHSSEGATGIGVLTAFTIVAGIKQKGLKLSEEQEKFFTELENQIDAEIKSALTGFVNAKDVETQLEAFRAKMGHTLTEEEKKSLNDTIESVKKQAAEIQKFKDMGVTDPQKAITIREQIKSFLKDNKEKFDAFKRGDLKSFGTDKDGNAGIILEEKAAITMTVGASTGSSDFLPGVEVVPGLVDLARNRPFIEQYANSSSTNSARIVWAEKYNPQGNAAFIAEGAVKPLISFEIRTIESYAKKVADKIKVSTEMLDDVDFMAAEIEKELKYQVDIKVDAELLTGAGDGTSSATTLKGLDAHVGGYTLTTIATTDPNNYDAIRAARAQVVSMNFDANIVFINPIDGANMDLVKDANGRPLAMEYKDANGKVYRLTVVETNQIPVGSMLLGDITRFKIRNYKPFAVYYGWVNDDFEKNLVTIIGERRLHAYVASNDVGAFVYDTFANIKTAITAV